jgi:thiol-disulfide isomerase/thioredoxin
MPRKFGFVKAVAMLVGAFFAVAAPMAQAELMVGDPAPKLQVGKWIQGGAVNGFDTDHVYLVEFWATWCGPCIASIPHVNELWQKFKDRGVVVIGQNVWDDDSNVPAFVKKMGDKMTYRVAIDDKSRETNGFMSEHWWKRKVNNHTIPHAFIINKEGRIAWIGHPGALTEKLLNDILSSHYDLAQAAAEYKELQQKNQKMADGEDKLFSAMKQKKWDDAESTLNELVNEFPKPPMSFTLTRFEILLGQKKYDEAYQFADSLSASHPEDAALQNILAWKIIAQDGVEQRNLALAMKFAERANKAADGKNPAILDTLARVQFMSGKKSEAIATEQKAVEAAPDAEKNSYNLLLADYQQGKLPDVKE